MAYFDPTITYDAGGMDRGTLQNLPSALWQRLMDTISWIAGTHGKIGDKTPTVRVTKSGVQSIASGSFVTLTWDTETKDNDALHDNAVSNSRLTAVTAGAYFVFAHVRFGANGTGRRALQFLRNGVSYSVPENSTDSGTDELSLVLMDVVELTAGQYVEVQALQSSGGALNVTTQSYFGMFRVAA